jgi:hypothetical protein
MTTLSIRLPSIQRNKLKEKAAALKVPESELVRAWITRALDDTSLLERAGQLVGVLDSSASTRAVHPRKASIRRNNWRT